ncbi:MAG: YicC family protein [Bacteroidetes bacterium]|nr:YicC family protein [Bacteroidota bacterium]
MTGFGNATLSGDGMTVSVEIRSVNSRFYEFSARVPKHLQGRELDLKEMVRAQLKRGKVNLTLTVDKADGAEMPLHVDLEAAKMYHHLLTQLRDAVGLTEEVKLENLLQFSDVFTTEEKEDLPDEEWALIMAGVEQSVAALFEMRRKEGEELTRDLEERVRIMDATIDRIEELSRGRAALERDRLTERLRSLLADEKIDPARLDTEIALLADKMDITEEMVRFRSHTKFFLETLQSEVSEGRKLSFLLQEMNREANTISSKSYDASIAHMVVGIKEELERIREQIQNIE